MGSNVNDRTTQDTLCMSPRRMSHRATQSVDARLTCIGLGDFFRKKGINENNFCYISPICTEPFPSTYRGLRRGNHLRNVLAID